MKTALPWLVRPKEPAQHGYACSFVRALLCMAVLCMAAPVHAAESRDIADADAAEDTTAEATPASVDADSDDADEAGPPSGEDGKSEESVLFFDLLQAQRRALGQNPSLSAGAERVEQARQLVVRARSLYYPQIDLNYTYTMTWLPSGYTDSINAYLDEAEDTVRTLRRTLYRVPVSSPFLSLGDRRTLRSYLNTADDSIDLARDYLDSPQKNTTANITAGWLLFDGFAREFANAMARHGYGEAQAAFRDGQRILLDAIAQAYYGGQYAREQIGISEASIVFFERLYKEAGVRREVGRGSTSDVLNFETALYAAKANLLRARREHEMARIALAVLLGYEEGFLADSIQLADLEIETPETMVLPEAGPMISLAMAYRPDLEQRELGLKRAKASVRREYAQFAPQVAAVATAQTVNINETGIDMDRITSTVGINASMTLFSGGRRRSELIEARHARRESEWRLVEAEQKIAGEVRQALLDLEIAQEGLALQRKAAKSVERNRDLVEKEYNAGKAMLVRLNQAQNDYMQAMGMLAQAQVNLQRSWQALHHATGVSLALLNGEHAKSLAGVPLSAHPNKETDDE